jgi:hypothetical protein
MLTRKDKIIYITSDLIIKLGISQNIFYNNDVVNQLNMYINYYTDISEYEIAVKLYGLIQSSFFLFKQFDETMNTIDNKWKIWKLKADSQIITELSDYNKMLMIDIKLFSFCDKKQISLILRNYNLQYRKYIRNRCEQLRLICKHSGCGEDNIVLTITKPLYWKFSDPAPILKSKK